MNTSDARPPSRQADIRFLVQYRRVQTWVMIFGPGLFTVAALVFGYLHDHRYGVLFGAGLFFGLLTWAMLGVRRSLGRRIRALRETSARRSRIGARQRVVLGISMVLATSVFLLLIVSLIDPDAIGFLSSWELWRGWVPAGEPFLPEMAALIAAALALVAAITSAVFAQYYAATSEETLVEAKGLACWFRAGAIVSLLVTAVLAARGFGSPFGEKGLAMALYILDGLLVVEMFFRGVMAVFFEGYRRKAYKGARVRTHVFSLQLLSSRFSPIASLFAVMAEAFGIDLRGTWALTFIRKSLLPIAVGLTIAGWAWTSIVMVNVDEQGVLEVFGRRASDKPMEAGLHFVWPWPINTVQRVPVHRIQTVPIGFEGAKLDSGMLWTIEHAEEEYKLLVGDGRDLVTVNATLSYKVSDIFEYLYNTQDPVARLDAISNRILMSMTVNRSLNDILRESSVKFGSALKEAIIAECESRKLGIEVVDLNFQGLHPPVAVASDYQAVVSAQIEKQTIIRNAEAYRNEEIPRAKGRAYETLAGASIHEWTRLSNARGESAAFVARLESYRISPKIFVLRHYLDILQQMLEGKRFHVIDHRIERDGGTLWLLE